MKTATSRTAPSAYSRSRRTIRRPAGRRLGPVPLYRRGAAGLIDDMTLTDLLLQQTINGLSLGAMYALLALGFTLVYGILELINFAHFNVFMVGSFIAMGTLQMFGLSGQDIILTGLPLVGVLLVAFAVTMISSGLIGVAIERLCLRPLRNVKGPAAMITTIGVSYILFNIILLTVGAEAKNFPNPMPPSATHRRRGAGMRVMLIWGVALVLMAGFRCSCRKPDRQGDARDRAGRGSGAHDGRGGGQGHDHGLLPWLGAGRCGRADLRPVLQLHQLHHRLHRRPARLHRRGAGRHRQRAGRDGGRRASSA